jgi:hypothetical protein
MRTLRAMKPSSSPLPADPLDATAMNIPSPDDDATVWQTFWREHNVEPIDTYIAGGRSIINGRNWRQWCEAYLPIAGVDPFRDVPQNALYQFVGGDLGAVDNAKLVLAHYPGGYASHGMAAEMGYAVATGTTVFYIDESEAPDLFLVGLAKRFFPSLETCATWWARRVVNGIRVP